MGIHFGKVDFEHFTVHNHLSLCSIISLDEFLRALEGNGYEVKRGKYISVKGKEQKNFLRLRSLGNGYTEKDIEKRIAGEVIDIVSDDPRNVIAGKRAEQKTEKKVDTVLDIQSIIAKNKGPG